jgi:two-component system phosphate regulon sensor histidine kinase PhoR
MRSVLFRKVFIAYIIITSLLLVSLEIYLSNTIKNNYIRNLKDGLIVQANLMADQMPFPPPHNLDDFCKRFKGKTGARITIVDSAGTVLGDSDEPSNMMENHSNRPEIRDADINGVGSSIRLSKTVKKELFYLALAVGSDTDRKFLRLSVPLHNVNAEVDRIRKKIIFASFAVSLVVFAFALLQTRKLIKSIGEISAFSREVAAGNFGKRLFLKERDELRELGESIGTMAGELRARLEQSEAERQKIEAIVRNMLDGLILADTNGRILLVNSALTNLFGIGSDIEGKTLIEALRNNELADIVARVAANKEQISGEIDVTYPKELCLMVRAAPFYSRSTQGETPGVVLTFHDITRLKKLEEVRKDFVANVTHEIKTPITAIKGFAETLIEGALDDKDNALKFLETIKNNSERLNSLVNDLLVLSRIELGDIAIDKTDVNIEEVVDSVIATLSEKAGSKGLHLKKQLSSDVTDINADRDRLIQILINLVDNGIKFTEKGRVTVEVQGKKMKNEDGEEKDFVEIAVEDTGAGIPRKHLSRLGERFYRVDRARSRELGGTGLGLAIVKHLVKAHGWEMKIESTEGQGTTVRLMCPVI